MYTLRLAMNYLKLLLLILKISTLFRCFKRDYGYSVIFFFFYISKENREYRNATEPKYCNASSSKF